MKIKIKRDELIKRMKESLLVMEDTYSKQILEYDKALVPIKVLIKAELIKMTKIIDKDFAEFRRRTAFRHSSITLHFDDIQIPEKPQSDILHLKKMIRILEASCEDIITVTTGDYYSRYL